MENKSEIQPDIIHLDSHGQSELVFGLAYLLRIKRSGFRLSSVLSAGRLLALDVVNHSPVEEMDRAVGVAGEARVVSDHADCGPAAV